MKINLYNVDISTHPPVEIPTEELPCITSPYSIPLKFIPWADNTINKLLEAGMIQHTMSTWASPVIIIPKKGLQPDPDDLVKLCLCCNYHKLNLKLPADFWNHEKEGRKIVKQGINTPYPLPWIDKIFDTICTGAFHGLQML